MTDYILAVSLLFYCRDDMAGVAQSKNLPLNKGHKMKLVNKVLVFSGLVLSPLFVSTAQAEERVELLPEYCYEDIEGDTFKFGWPNSGKVSVIEHVTKGDKTAELSYDLLLKPAKKKPDVAFNIGYRKLKVNSVDGVDSSNDKVAEAAQAIKVMSLMQPAMDIAPSGEFADIDISQRVVSRILSQIPREQMAGAPSFEQMTEMLNSSKMHTIMRKNNQKMWDALVGSWIDFPNMPGERFECIGSDKVYGSIVPFDIEVKQAAVKDMAEYKGKVKLEFVMKAQTDTARHAIMKMFSDMPAETKPVLEIVEQHYIVTLITDPNTLKPVLATTESLSLLKFKGKQAARKYEKHRYQFTWH